MTDEAVNNATREPAAGVLEKKEMVRPFIILLKNLN